MMKMLYLYSLFLNQAFFFGRVDAVWDLRIVVVSDGRIPSALVTAANKSKKEERHPFSFLWRRLHLLFVGLPFEKHIGGSVYLSNK